MVNGVAIPFRRCAESSKFSGSPFPAGYKGDTDTLYTDTLSKGLDKRSVLGEK